TQSAAADFRTGPAAKCLVRTADHPAGHIRIARRSADTARSKVAVPVWGAIAGFAARAPKGGAEPAAVADVDRRQRTGSAALARTGSAAALACHPGDGAGFAMKRMANCPMRHSREFRSAAAPSRRVYLAECPLH